jgi:hypothetical protein
MKKFFDLAVLAIAIAALSTLAAAQQPPAWMKTAAAAAVPTYAKDVPAVDLHDEQQVTLGTDGKLVTTENYAIKMLNREGRSFAIARAFYLVSAGKIREIEAWLIRSDGSVK